MNRTPRPNTGERSPAQISTDLLARMDRAEERHAGNDHGEPGGEPFTQRLDFDAVLKSVSPGAVDALATEPIHPGLAEGLRDRNLSSIIEMIRDEGPAGEEVPPEPADDRLEIRGKSDAGENAGPMEKESPPSSDVVPPRPARERRGAGPVFATTLVVLLMATIALAFFSWQQHRRQTDLEEQLAAARQMMTLMEERQRAMEGRLVQRLEEAGDLVLREQLNRALEEQQRRVAGELSLFTAMLLPALPPLPAAGVPRETPASLAQGGASEAVRPRSAGKKPAPQKPPKGNRSAEIQVEKKGAAQRSVESKRHPRPTAAAKPEGSWLVYLRSFGTEKAASKALADLAGQLPRAVIHKARVRGRPVWRLTVAGFASKKEALAFRADAKGNLGFSGAWIARNR